MLRRRMKTYPMIKRMPLVAFNIALSVGRKRINSTGIQERYNDARLLSQSAGRCSLNLLFIGWPVFSARITQAIKQSEQRRKDHHRRRKQDERSEVQAVGGLLRAGRAFNR